MEQSPPHIGILFFSRSAKAESKAKLFTAESDSRKNQELAQQFISQTLRQVKQSGFPVVICDEKDQHGSTFGARFANAFSAMFERGFQYVIAVGNDTPELTSDHIQEAAKQLRSQQADIVLGPATDGGTWLTAFSQEAFWADRFRQLPWQTNTLFDSILEQFGNELTISSLSQFADIDNPQSLTAFLGRKEHLLFRFVKLLQAVISGPSSFRMHGKCPLPFLSFSKSNLLRAPPLG